MKGNARPMAAKRRPRKKPRKGHRAWLLIPAIILAGMLGWLYRTEIMDLATFKFSGFDFTGPAGETPTGGQITEGDRKELEKILRKQ